jgi:predicted AAA+ superfamily ATPase
MYLRRQKFEGLTGYSTFLWGARQTGKSTLLKKLYPDAPYFDLLLSNEYERFLRNPSLLREILSIPGLSSPVIIDEIQRIPSLLNEVHWLIENRGIRFILSGSSPRKILRSGGNLLGGRAMRYELYPLTSAEVPEFDLLKALKSGLLPRHYLAKNSDKLLSAYIGSYLRDEISTEAKIRNISSFSRFLEAAAFSNGEMVNFSNIAAECGISSPTVKEYFQILEDTMTGRFVQAFQKKPKRRVITAPKFYYFDVGIAGFLLKRGSIEYGSEAFGKALEHFIYQELFAYSHYSDKNFKVSYWRTASQIEVDFILGEHEVALEIKATNVINPRHLKGLKSFSEEYTTKKSIIVSCDPYPRKIDDITALPWNIFLEKLWSSEII